MFRPYNLTSLAAWTAGSLAGNAAYYRTKGSRTKSSYFRPGSVNVRGPYPENLLLLQRRLQTLSDEVNRLLAQLVSRFDAGDHKIELTSLIHLFAYNEWLQRSAKAIKADARKAH